MFTDSELLYFEKNILIWGYWVKLELSSYVAQKTHKYLGTKLFCIKVRAGFVALAFWLITAPKIIHFDSNFGMLYKNLEKIIQMFLFFKNLIQPSCGSCGSHFDYFTTEATILVQFWIWNNCDISLFILNNPVEFA